MTEKKTFSVEEKLAAANEYIDALGVFFNDVHTLRDGGPDFIPRPVFGKLIKYSHIRFDGSEMYPDYSDGLLEQTEEEYQELLNMYKRK